MDSGWIDVVPTNELPPGSRHVIEVDDVFVVVFNDNGNYFAVENRCSHDNVPLAAAELVDGQIICPRHGAHFCLRTGTALTAPAYEPIQVFPTRVVNSVVQIRDNRWD